MVIVNMIKVNVDKLKDELRELNTLINDYETNYYNLYNELKNVSNFWKDDKSVKFFSNIDVEKLQVGKLEDEIEDIRNIYNYLIDKYNCIGNDIKIDMDLRDDISLQFDKLLEIIYDGIDNFKSLDFEYCNSIANDVYSNIDNLIYVSNLIVSLKSKVNKKFNLCEEIEKNINLKITKINVEILKENDINDIIG